MFGRNAKVTPTSSREEKSYEMMVLQNDVLELTRIFITAVLVLALVALGFPVREEFYSLFPASILLSSLVRSVHEAMIGVGVLCLLASAVLLIVKSYKLHKLRQ